VAITCDEKFQSRKTTGGDQPAEDLIFILRGSDDEVALLTTILNATTLYYNGMIRKTWDVEQVDNSLWIGTVKYGRIDTARWPVGTITIAADTTGGQMHLSQSITTVNKYAPAGKTAPDFKGAIGVTQDAVEGVDVPAPEFKFTVTKVFAKGTTPDLGDCYKLKSKTNAASFTVTDTFTGITITLGVGECQFLGLKFTGQRFDTNIEICYEFMAAPNATGLIVGDITGIAKGGFEYLWTRYDEVVDATAHRLVRRPTAAYVEQVFFSGDFTVLGI